MLDSRPGLCTVFVDYTPTPDVVTRYPCYPTPFFPAAFSPRQGRHLAGDNPRNQHRGPSGLPALPSAVAVSHHSRDVIMSRPGSSHVVTLPPLSHAAAATTHSLNEKQRFRHRFSARVAFPQFSLACYNGTANTVGPYPLGQSRDIKTNLSCETEPAARSPKIQTLDRFVARQHHPSSSSDLLKQSLFRSHFQGGLHDERWWKPMLGAGEGWNCSGLPGTWWKTEAETQCWQDRGNRNTASVEDCLLGTSRESRERAEITTHTMDSLTMSPSRILTSAPVTAASRDSTTQRPKTQEGLADRKECSPRTSIEDTNPQPLKQELTHSQEIRHCRPRRVKDNSTKLHPMMSSLISAKRLKNQNRKMPEQQQQQQQHDADSDTQQESEQRKTFRCLQCRYMTDRKNNLKRHVVTMHHKATRLLECCATIFHSKASLREHVSRYHRGGYRCQVCSRNFCRKALLRRHLAVHSGQKDFACQLCGYATSHKSNLERHQRVHSRKTSSLGPRLSSHRLGEDREETASESARFTGGRILDYDEVSNSNMSSGQGSPSSYQYNTNMPETEMEILEHQMSPHFSENQPCRLMLSGTTLQQKNDTVSPSSTVLISTDNSRTFIDSSNSGTAISTNLDLVSSRTTEAAYSQFMEESLRLCRGDTNLAKDITSLPTDSVHIQDCRCSPKTDPAPSLTSDSVDDEVQFATRKAFSCGRVSRHRVLSRKVCFPNRLNETYQSPVHKHASEKLTPDCSSHQADRKQYNDGDNDDTSENLKENEIPSQNTQMLSQKLPSLDSETTTNGTNQTCGSDRTLEEKMTEKPQNNKHRLCSRLLYRCSSCRACFLHQGELCGHVCRHPQAGYIFRFPLTSSVKKGCIPTSEVQTEM